MSRKIIISERQLKMIQENIQSSIKDGLPKKLLKQIYDGKTSLGNNPAFPPEDELKFEEKLLLPAYKHIVSDIEQLYPDFDKNNIGEFKTELSKLLKRCKDIEQPLKSQLELLVMKIIKDIFNVTKDDVDLNIEMVDTITVNDIKMSLLPETTDEIEFDGIEDIKGLNDDIYKRRVVNCLMQGLSNRFIHLYELYIKDIFVLNDGLLPLYKRIITLNEYINFMEDANLVNENDITFGSTSDIMVKTNDKSTINVIGVNFISLLHESVRAMLELISVSGLPNDHNKMKYVLKKSDFRYATYWDIRFGISMWNKIEEKLGDSEYADILPYLFYTIITKPTEDFNTLLQNILANTKQGKIELKSMIDGIRYKIDKDNFESDLEIKRNLIGDDKYFTI